MHTSPLIMYIFAILDAIAQLESSSATESRDIQQITWLFNERSYHLKYHQIQVRTMSAIHCFVSEVLFSDWSNV